MEMIEMMKMDEIHSVWKTAFTLFPRRQAG